VSPLRRARETARALGLDAVTTPELRDCDHGRWAGRTFEEVLEKEADALQAWTRDPYAAPHGGESIAAVVQRIAAWLHARTEAGRLIAVTHPSIVRAAILYVLDAPLTAYYRMDAAPFHCTELTYDGRRWMLHAMNVKR
jgi:broad specificity phosphatase PhoE